MNPTVSAIIIFRDGLPYISEAIDSVMSQAYEPLELILRDDGSTDGSEKIAVRLLAGAPSRIRFL